MRRGSGRFGRLAAIVLLVSVITALSPSAGPVSAGAVTISGTVTDFDGTPLAGARVVLSTVIFPSEWQPQTVSGDDGRFQLTGEGMLDTLAFLPPAGRSDLLAEVVHFTREAPGLATLDHRFRRAASLTVDITAGGAPSPDADVDLWRRPPGMTHFFPFDAPSADGRTFTDMAPGVYLVWVDSGTPGYASEWYPSTPYFSRAERLTLDEGESLTLDLALERSARITGRLFRPDGSPEPFPLAEVTTRLADIPGEPGGSFGCNAEPDPGAPAGTYVRECLHPNASYLVSTHGTFERGGAWYDGVDNPIEATAVAVTAGATTSGIDLRPGVTPAIPTFTGVSPHSFRAGRTTTGVRVFGSNFPPNPNSLYLSVERWPTIDPPISFTVTDVVSTTELVVSVTVGGKRPDGTQVTGSMTRSLYLGRYSAPSGNEVQCFDCFTYGPAPTPPVPPPGPPTPPPPAEPPVVEKVVETVVPGRLLETRVGERTVDGVFAGGGELSAGGVVELVVAGRGGVPVDAAAVMLNVAAVLPRDAGFVTVWPCGEDRPLASSLNFPAGVVVPNAVLAKVGVGGRVCVFSSAPTHLIADVTGFAR